MTAEAWLEEALAPFDDEAAEGSDNVRPNGKANGQNKRANGSFNYSPRPELLSRRASDIPPEHVDWSWVGRLARGKHTCVAGEPGTGKSLFSDFVVGAITTGGHWPCGEGRAPIGNVIIFSAEDSAADTIVPRLMAVGADLNRVHIVSAVATLDGNRRRTFNLQSDIKLLEDKIAVIGDVLLVVIDPISSYLGKVDSHKNAEVRSVLEPLTEMADRTKVAVLSVTHFSKVGAGSNTRKALHRFMGSVAFTGAPRVCFAVIEDPEDANRRLFLYVKGNVSAVPQGLAFRLDQTIVADDIVACRLAFETEPVIMTADQAVAAEAAGTQNTKAPRPRPRNSCGTS